METKRKIERRYKLTNAVLDRYLAHFNKLYNENLYKDQDPGALAGLPRFLIHHSRALPQVDELINRAIQKQRPLNKKDALFVSRELARAEIEHMEKFNGDIFYRLLPPQEIVRSGEAARARALQLFYKDVESIMIRESRDPYAYMVDFRRYVDIEQRHKFFGLPAFCRKEGLSWAEFRRKNKKLSFGGRNRLVNEWREYTDVMRRNMLYMMELVREKIILDNIALFGPPQVDAPSYGGIVRIENADSIPEKDLSELKTALLSFQALTAPTTSRAQLGVTVRFKILDRKSKRDEATSVNMYEYTPHYLNHDKSVNLFKHARSAPDAIKCIVYHEMMHAVDFVAPGLMRQTFAFLKTRCGMIPSEDIEFYPELVGRRGQMAFGIRDSFMSAYTGRVYLHPGLGLVKENYGRMPYELNSVDPYEYNATEVSTIAIEQFTCPEAMLSLLSNDPELFSHALAICYGTYFDLNAERP